MKTDVAGCQAADGVFVAGVAFGVAEGGVPRCGSETDVVGLVEVDVEALEDSQLPAGEALASFSSVSTGASPAKRTRTAKSPFDAWQRTKAQSGV